MKIKVNNDNIKTDDISIYNNGTKFSYKGNMYHNIDGPAREYADGDETWRFEGKVHRKYGPSCKWRSGDRWKLNDEHYSMEEFMEKFL